MSVIKRMLRPSMLVYLISGVLYVAFVIIIPAAQVYQHWYGSFGAEIVLGLLYMAVFNIYNLIYISSVLFAFITYKREKFYAFLPFIITTIAVVIDFLLPYPYGNSWAKVIK